MVWDEDQSSHKTIRFLSQRDEKMNRNINRAEARRADKTRRGIGSRFGVAPNRTVSGICPVWLSAVGNQQICRATWMDCLRELNGHLTEIKQGINVPSNMDAALHRMGVLGLVTQVVSKGLPCCPEGSSNKARYTQLHDTLLGPEPPDDRRGSNLGIGTGGCGNSLPDRSGSGRLSPCGGLGGHGRRVPRPLLPLLKLRRVLPWRKDDDPVPPLPQHPDDRPTLLRAWVASRSSRQTSRVASARRNLSGPTLFLVGPTRLLTVDEARLKE